MTEVNQVVDLSPGDRIDRLSRHASIAFAARCALRVVPAYIPSLQTADQFRREQLATATICGLMALHASSASASAQSRNWVKRVRDVFKGEPGGPATAAASRCATLAVRAAAARGTQLQSAVRSLFDEYRTVASEFRVFDLFAAVAAEDLAALEPLNLGEPLEDGRDVPLAYFTRPLFGLRAGVPGEWQPAVDDWKRALERAGLTRLHEFYLRLCGGTSLDAEEVGRAIDAWSRGELYLPGEPSPKTSTDDGPPPPQEAESDAAAASTSEPDVWVFADRPLEGEEAEDLARQDQFQFRDYASALAAVLDHDKTETPFTMAINAPWGAGKTTLANMIVAELHQLRKDHYRPRHVICYFNAWMHDDAPNLATAFISEVTRKADSHRLPIWWLLNPVPSAVLTPLARNLRRMVVTLLILALTLGGVFWIADHLAHVDQYSKDEAAKTIAFQGTEIVTRDAAGKEVGRTTSETRQQTRDVKPPPVPPRTPDRIDQTLTWFHTRTIRFGAFATALGGIVGLLARVLASTSLSGLVQSPQKAAEAGVIPQAQRQLKRLIRQATWRKNRFVVFVDDIERCRPPRSIDVLDAVNQLMDHERVLVVFLGDMAAVAAAAQMKYKELSELYVPSAGIALTGPDRGKESFGRLYLQKIVQYQFDLPVPPKEKIRAYMSQLAVTPEAQGGANVRNVS